MAAAVPVSANVQSDPLIPSLLGAAIVVAEGAHELLRFQPNWTGFGATAEALKREKFLYQASAGPYRKRQDAVALLAERTEALISTETASWREAQEDQQAAR